MPRIVLQPMAAIAACGGNRGKGPEAKRSVSPFRIFGVSKPRSAAQVQRANA